MADIIRNRAYQLWGVQPESPPKTGNGAKKAVAGKPKAVAKKATTKKAPKAPSPAKPASAKRR